MIRKNRMVPLDERILLSRRGFAGGCLAIPSVVPAGGVLASGRLEEFLEVSAGLTGFSRDELDPAFAEAMIDALVATGKAQALDRLLEGEPSGDVAGEVVAAWYSGILATAAGLVAYTFEDALAWSAVDFAAPPGFCVEPGSPWARPPQT